MNTIDRREDIVRRLTISAEPISASTLAAAYGVSRQIIVGDIALLRASYNSHKYLQSLAIQYLRGHKLYQN